MNKKLWFTGGEPNINADDLLRDSTANNRSFQHALRAWLTGYNENFIISGCDLTINPGVDASITEGYIFLNGEILRVDAQTVAAGTNDFYMYEKQVTYDPRGTKVFVDLVTHETWQKNRGVLVNAISKPVPTDKLDAAGANWPQKLKNTIKGTFVHLTPGDHDLTVDPDLNYIRFDMSGSASAYTVIVPNADDQIHTRDINHFFFYESDPNLPRCTYDFFDQHGTQLAHVTHPEYSIILNNNGVWAEAVYIDLSTDNFPPPLKEIMIPSWNMQTTNILTIPHTLISKDNIKEISARVYNNAGDTLFKYDTDGLIRYTDTDIILQHATNSIFDSSDFNGTGFNRGKIYIQT